MDDDETMANGSGNALRMGVAVVAICAVMNLISRGMAETFGVFLIPLESEFGWTRTQITGIYSVFMLTQAFFGIPSGLILDRLGPRALYGIGLVCLGSGFFLAARIDALWQLYVCIGFLVGIGVSGLGMLPTTALVSRWFPERMSGPMGLALAGFGVGVLLIVPVSRLAIDAVGWRDTYETMGIAVFVLAVPIMLLPWRRIARGHPTYQSRQRQAVRDATGWTLAMAVRTAGFWGLFFVFFHTSVCIFIIVPQLVAFFVHVGFDPFIASLAFGINGSLAVLGIMGTGWVAERLGRLRTVTASYSLTLIGVGMLFVISAFPVLPFLVLFVIPFGLSMGARGPIISSLAANLFPGQGFGAIYGTMSIGIGLGAAGGAAISGILYDVTGGYEAIFAFSGFTATLGLSLFWLIPALSRGRHPRTQ